jgi:predicted DNA-binding ribbon-helix-helix protein
MERVHLPNVRQKLATHRRSAIVKRSVVIGGHKTSVTLEDAFWKSLKQIAQSQNMTLSDMVGVIDRQRHSGNLSSTIRLFVFEHAARSPCLTTKKTRTTMPPSSSPSARAPAS